MSNKNRSSKKKRHREEGQKEPAETTCPHCKPGPEAYRMLFNLYKFDVDLAREIVADGREAIELEPDDVKYALEWSRIYPEHLSHVDVRYPGIISHYWYPEPNGPVLQGSVLIDGHHRAARSLELERPFFVYVLSPEESLRVTVRAPGSEMSVSNSTHEQHCV